MASNATTCFKFAICLVLLVSLECRVIKIVEDADDSNDIIVKIVIKHAKKKAHSKFNDDYEIATSEKKELNDVENKAIEGLSSTTDADKHPVDVTSLRDNDGKFELPDNLFEDSEDISNMQSPSNEDLKDKPEPVPRFESRSGIQVGFCPAGFIRRGRFCLPADK